MNKITLTLVTDVLLSSCESKIKAECFMKIGKEMVIQPISAKKIKGGAESWETC